MCVCVCVCVCVCCNVHTTQKEGKPALVLACEGGHTECVRLLMSHPNIEKNATYGESQLCGLHRCEDRSRRGGRGDYIAVESGR